LVQAKDGANVLPFAWSGVALHAVGATTLRVQVTPTGSDGLALEAVDTAGQPVLSVAAIAFRPVDVTRIEAGTPTRDALFHLTWTEHLDAAAQPTRAVTPVQLSAPDEAAALADAAPAVTVLEATGDDAAALTGRVLTLLQAWLSATGGLAESRLVVVTRGAVAAGHPAGPELAAAAVWGLIRAAQAEHPDRIVLLDLDEQPVDAVLDRALALDEPQVAVRGDALLVPRLAHAQAPESPVIVRDGGTVLITGGTGSLGQLVAEHLVTRHGVRHLLLVGRRGPQAPGAHEVADRLRELGAEVDVRACDVSDGAALAALARSIDSAHPLAGIVHTAGVLDDGVITALTPARLDGVFAAKATAASHLAMLADELAAGGAGDLDLFVLFSSASGVLGSPGQGNYGAANAYLDALAHRRRAAGRTATSLAWGLWQQNTGMTAHLSAADQARMTRGGVRAIMPVEGMELFDAALGTGEAHLVPIKLDMRALRADAAAGVTLPAMLRGLVPPVRAARSAAVGAGAGSAGLLRRLTGLSAGEQEAALLALVGTHVAATLGHGDVDGVRPGTAFRDIGFDSLTSVELRNRLREATGLRLTATVVFDYPTPAALAGHLRDELGSSTDALAQVDEDLRRLESLIAGLRQDDGRRAGVADRLQSLLVLCRGGEDGERAVADQLEAASADEVLSFIDKELGPM
ncbi:type I polyketide synthase, partial [Frankia sp. AgKG'84/4]